MSITNHIISFIDINIFSVMYTASYILLSVHYVQLLLHIYTLGAVALFMYIHIRIAISTNGINVLSVHDKHFHIHI